MDSVSRRTVDSQTHLSAALPDDASGDKPIRMKVTPETSPVPADTPRFQRQKTSEARVRNPQFVWSVEDMPADELAVDSPGLVADGTERPSREDVERYFRRGLGSAQPPQPRQDSHSLSSSPESVDSAETDKRERVAEAVDALVRAELLMASLTVEEKALALNYAASHGYLRVVRKLVRQGVDVNATDQEGRTALSAAFAGNHQEVAHYLIRHAPAIRVRRGEGNHTNAAFSESGGMQQINDLSPPATDEMLIRDTLRFNINQSLRAANGPARDWYAQSPTTDLSQSREEG